MILAEIKTETPPPLRRWLTGLCPSGLNFAKSMNGEGLADLNCVESANDVERAGAKAR